MPVSVLRTSFVRPPARPHARFLALPKARPYPYPVRGTLRTRTYSHAGFPRSQVEVASEVVSSQYTFRYIRVWLIALFPYIGFGYLGTDREILTNLVGSVTFDRAVLSLPK